MFFCSYGYADNTQPVRPDIFLEDGKFICDIRYFFSIFGGFLFKDKLKMDFISVECHPH